MSIEFDRDPSAEMQRITHAFKQLVKAIPLRERVNIQNRKLDEGELEGNLMAAIPIDEEYLRVGVWKTKPDAYGYLDSEIIGEMTPDKARELGAYLFLVASIVDWNLGNENRAD